VLNATHTLLVIPAIWRTSDLATLADLVATFGITHVVMTMTDLTHRIGGLFAVCDITGAKLALVGDSPSGANCLRVPAASALAAQLLSNGGTHAVR
jgi:signal recognition particle GTPase